ncbi:unnamed protein product, partial [Mesorhabditis belari]|uniref:Uncharacterized protein n=1 Tax=Mesorhabditis belari TaxID=2138241 RepID=A0AAF3FMD8_9BILA
MDDSTDSDEAQTPLLNKDAFTEDSEYDSLGTTPLLGAGPSSSGDVRVDMPNEDKPASPHDRFPKEKTKTILSCILVVFSGFLNTLTLSFVHELLPDQPPLPDVGFRHTTYYALGLNICEYLMLGSFISVLVLILFHRHRWIVLRRLAFIGSILYLCPVHYDVFNDCPKSRPKLLLFTKNWPYNSANHLSIIYWRIYTTSMEDCSPCIMVDCDSWNGGITQSMSFLSYFICTRVFWSYHTLAAHPTLKTSSNSHLRKEWWFIFFRYIEGSVVKPIPRRYDIPIPLPRKELMATNMKEDVYESEEPLQRPIGIKSTFTMN